MAFNFNWTPLSTSSSEFYTRAKDLLTTALNKAPKPPIIVDNIYVEELNLGSTAPELEILEIGDLAEDRFRGIFKISYGGNAVLTLKTKVQANPLSTYLSTTPSFTSPCPLAASAPLTIPLQITLSEIRLSGFIILVFSKAKGITLVFRNDPLESLRVSSTFDSIPFIKDYLQKEIERVVRGLFQEELPVGIHRLSLRWFNPDYAASLEAESNASTQPTTHPSYSAESDDEGIANPYINPLAPSPEEQNQQQLSEKNLGQLDTLLRSQKTLSVGSSAVGEAVFRAWAAPSMVPAWSNGGLGWTDLPGTPAAAAGTTYTFNEAGDAVSVTSSGHSGNGRPSLSASSSNMSVPGFCTNSSPASVSGARLGRGRKKKHRIVNLRKKTGDGTASASDGASTKESTTELTASTAQSIYSDEYDSKEGSVVMEEEDLPEQVHYQARGMGSAAGSVRRSDSVRASLQGNGHLAAPPMVRDLSTDASSSGSGPRRRDSSPIPARSAVSSAASAGVHRMSTSSSNNPANAAPATPTSSISVTSQSPRSDCRCRHTHIHTHSDPHPHHMQMPNPWLNLASMLGQSGSGGSILEQAVLLKLAGEVARLQAREKEREMESEREERRRMDGEGEAPPAYGV
ncbi:hypothetical protein L211DRAFT_839852 [Terfezia boudieri ATCC MYA-4762]|uniref:Mitochondrial distribution and morphology protein 34 n=1 Tax=Terfezia boudieri ATCC MYA-4762 TaxID=1051890 RepID=A0A3N4LHM4_9PEZI|nr:hypothetical protein L211DRAFT_839852 [Terfezia boudieri ATCC MYA-4762]